MSLDTALLVAIALLAGLVRGFSGFGAALIFMPAASMLVGPQAAAAVLMLIDLVCSILLVPKALPRLLPAQVAPMLAGATVTLPVGAWLLASTDPTVLRWAICALVSAMLVLLASGWRYAGEPRPAVTLGVGALAGLFSGIAQIAGPPVAAYWLSGRNETAAARANIILFFAGTSIVSLAAYFLGGLLTEPVIAMSLASGPAYGIGLLGGARLFGMASEVTYRRICFALIALSVAASLPVWSAGAVPGP